MSDAPKVSSEDGIIDDLKELPALDDGALEFLKAEYEHLASSLISNEEGGEKRVDVLLTLVAAVIAAIGIGADTLEANPALIPRVALAGSVVLLTYGVVTLRRIMERNVTTTEYLNGMRRIRATFAAAHPPILTALPFVPGKAPERTRDPWWGLNKAGFLEMVAATNCLFVAVAAAAVTQLPEDVDGVAGLFLGIGSALAAWLLQMKWADTVYRTLNNDRRKERNKAIAAWGHSTHSTNA